MKFFKTILLFFIIFLIGCGGGGDGVSNFTKEHNKTKISKLKLYSSYTILGGVSKIAVSKKRKTISTVYNNHLIIIDITDPKFPFLISKLKLEEFDFSLVDISFSKDSSKIYLIGKMDSFKRDRYKFYTLFEIIDVASLENPSVLSRMILEEEGKALYISQNEDKAYLAVGSTFLENSDPKILIFNIEDVYNPFLEDYFELSHTPSDIAFDEKEEFLYVTEGSFATEVFKNRDIIYSFKFDNFSGNIVVKDNDTIFISSLDDGIKIIKRKRDNSYSLQNVISPLDLDKAFNATLFDEGKKICISGGYSGILIADISNLSNPKIISESDFNESVRVLECKIIEDEDIAVLADSKSGIKIVKLKN